LKEANDEPCLPWLSAHLFWLREGLAQAYRYLGTEHVVSRKLKESYEDGLQALWMKAWLCNGPFLLGYEPANYERLAHEPTAQFRLMNGHHVPQPVKILMFIEATAITLGIATDYVEFVRRAGQVELAEHKMLFTTQDAYNLLMECVKAKV
jgi:hypothetical protein